MKKFNSEDAKVALYLVAAILIIYLVVKGTKGLGSIFESLGLKKTGQEIANAQTINTQSLSNVGTEDPWSPLYYQQAKSRKLYYQFFMPDTRDYIATRIWNSADKMYLYDNSAEMLAAIKSISYKTQLSQVAETFRQKYGADLLSWLKNKFDTSVQQANLAAAIDYVNKIPTGFYKTRKDTIFNIQP